MNIASRPTMILMVIILTVSIINCTSDRKKGEIREQLISVAIDYASKQLDRPELKTLSDSTIMVGDTSKRYFIHPSKVFTGLIDGDDKTDGIVSVTSMAKRGGMQNEHLIILDTGGKYLMVRAVESDMKILSLKDRIITAEIPTHPAGNPLHDCPVCVVVERYRFSNGDLERIK